MALVGSGLCVSMASIKGGVLEDSINNDRMRLYLLLISAQAHRSLQRHCRPVKLTAEPCNSQRLLVARVESGVPEQMPGEG